MTISKPTLETIKEVGRWILSAVAAWLITETLNQIVLVPESTAVKVWVFTYLIPVRALFQFALTAAGRAIDKYVFTVSKEDPKRLESETPKGIIPF